MDAEPVSVLGRFGRAVVPGLVGAIVDGKYRRGAGASVACQAAGRAEIADLVWLKLAEAAKGSQKR